MQAARHFGCERWGDWPLAVKWKPLLVLAAVCLQAMSAGAVRAADPSSAAELGQPRASASNQHKLPAKLSQSRHVHIEIRCQAANMMMAARALQEARGFEQRRLMHAVSRCYSRACPKELWCESVESRFAAIFNRACVQNPASSRVCQRFVCAVCQVRTKKDFMPEECGEWWSKAFADHVRLPYSRLGSADLALEALVASMRRAARPFLEAWAKEEAATDAEALAGIGGMSI